MTTYRTSYSGADFSFLTYVPVNSDWNKYQVGIDELEDEISELRAQLSEVERKLAQFVTTTAFSGDASSLLKKKSSLEDNIQRLKKLQADLRKSKANIIPVRLDTLQTISFQMHVDKQPVRALGGAYPKGYTRGPALIAGSMIFVVVQEHPLVKVMDLLNAGRQYMDQLPKHIPSDNSFNLYPTAATVAQLPPLHITALGVNEAGNAATFSLFGVEFLNDGMVVSINDVLTEVSINFVAQDMDLLRTLDTRGVLQIPAFSRAVTASNFLTTKAAALRKARRGLPF